MAYSIDICDLLSVQLDRLAKLHPHQLVGHVANLDFWLGEVRHCQNVIDNYRLRFERLRDSQANYVREHDTTTYSYETGTQIPMRAQRVPDDALKTSRSELREAFYRFLIRSYQEKLIDERMLRETADAIDLGIDLVDLRR